jgi:hypothetical protein
LRTAECPAVLSHISAAIDTDPRLWDIDLSVVHITRWTVAPAGVKLA